ncbi:MAG: hypothetical protein ACXU9U_04065 [Parachlamydiaceae bacterium]
MSTTQNAPISFLTFHDHSIGYEEWVSKHEILPDLLEKQRQNVKIRGFMYQGNEGNWILSAEPNLKSCCVGTSSKKGSQIFVKDFSLKKVPLSVVALVGEFQIQTTGAPYFYMLKEARLDEEPILLSYALIFSLGFILVLFVALRIKQN